MVIYMSDRFLNDLEEDILIEMFNIGMGKAAHALSIIAKQDVDVSVPAVQLIDAETVFSDIRSDEICCVIQKVKGEFDSVSVLIIPQRGSYEIVSKMLGSFLKGIPPSELYQDAMREIGNILINTCVGTVANSLNLTSYVELPFLQFGSSDHLFDGNLLKKDDVILNVGIHIVLSESNVSGKVFFIFGPISLAQLQRGLNGYLKQFR